MSGPVQIVVLKTIKELKQSQLFKDSSFPKMGRLSEAKERVRAYYDTGFPASR